MARLKRLVRALNRARLGDDRAKHGRILKAYFGALERVAAKDRRRRAPFVGW